jgi:hypothetical protein
MEKRREPYTNHTSHGKCDEHDESISCCKTKRCGYKTAEYPEPEEIGENVTPIESIAQRVPRQQ